MTNNIDPKKTEEELFAAYWEDRGADLAGEHAKQQVVLREHQGGLSVAVAEELSALEQAKRGIALEALLRGYREKLHKLSTIDRG